MIRRLFLLMVIIPSISFSQEKKFSSFELISNLPQQVKDYSDWPKYDLESMVFYNDTVYTLLVKENNLTSIPLTKKGDELINKKIILPPKYNPNTIARYNNKWYIATNDFGVVYIEENGSSKIIIEKPDKLFIKNIMFINNKILIYESFRVDYYFALYDLNGKLINTTNKGKFIFTYPFQFDNIIRNGFNDITVKNNTIYISEQYYLNNDGNENFVGGCQNMGFFVEREHRNQFIIKDLINKSEKERFNIPVKFKDSDLGIPEEDSFNLRVFSQDNNTFYFVTLKHGHLMIYKAVR